MFAVFSVSAVGQLPVDLPIEPARLPAQMTLADAASHNDFPMFDAMFARAGQREAAAFAELHSFWQWSLTDPVGVSSSFTYVPGVVISSMTTPYGTTEFTRGPIDPIQPIERYLEATDPDGHTERMERRMSSVCANPDAASSSARQWGSRVTS